MLARRRRRAQPARAVARCSRTSPRSSLARSGEEALRHLLKGEFAVILLDVYMPGMDGYETAQMIRSARADQAHPDRLPVGGQQGDRAPDARLCDGRGRLRLQAGRSDHPAVEGDGVRRPVCEDEGGRADGSGTALARKQASSGPEDGRDRQAHRRHRARLQQSVGGRARGPRAAGEARPLDDERPRSSA